MRSHILAWDCAEVGYSGRGHCEFTCDKSVQIERWLAPLAVIAGNNVARLALCDRVDECLVVGKDTCHLHVDKEIAIELRRRCRPLLRRCGNTTRSGEQRREGDDPEVVNCDRCETTPANGFFH